jgi:hypothetical protein
VVDRLFTSENYSHSDSDITYEQNLVQPIHKDLLKRAELMETKLERLKLQTGWQKVTSLRDLPLSSQLYYRTMVNIILLLIFLSIAEASVVYILAISNYDDVWKTNDFSWHKLWYFLITPYEFVINSEYPNVSETIIRPFMMIFVVVKFIMDMSRYERNIKKDVFANDQSGMFRTLRLKKLAGENEQDLKNLFEGITGANS